MKPLIVANWKCNPTTLTEAEKLFNEIRKKVKNIKKVETVIAAPFVYIPSLIKLGGNDLKVGAQNCFWEGEGAFTGEVSPQMLKDLGIGYVILGHSERRKYLGETDEVINKKLKKVLESGLSPILCVGDKSRESKEDIKEIDFQLEAAFQKLERVDLTKLVITYEPIWAISTTEGGAAATTEDAKEGVSCIRNNLNRLLGEYVAKKIRVIYGGSINSQNISSFINAGIDGGLVGAASLDAEEFINIVKSAGKA